MPSSDLPTGELALAVDIGGTFTDLVLMDRSTGSTWLHKTPTTPDPLDGLLVGMASVIADAGRAREEIASLRFGTTAAVNTLLTRQRRARRLPRDGGLPGGTPPGAVTDAGPARWLAEHGRPRTARGTLTVPARCESGFARPERSSRLSTRTLFEMPYMNSPSKASRSIAVAFMHSYANPVHETAGCRDRC